VILALAGLTPPENVRGQVSGRIHLEGLVVKPKVTVDAFGSGVRFGKVVVGDLIRVPRFIYQDHKLIVPGSHPMELRWVPQNTVVTAYGEVPTGVFSARGLEPVDFHLKCLNGSVDVLKRLNVIGKGEGGLTVVLDVGGSASYPVWSYTVAGSGRRIDLGRHVFAKPISRWKFDARMLNNEGILKAGIVVAKQGQMIDGDFGMGGWSLGHLDLSTWPVATSGDPDDLKGLPLDIENVARIRLKLVARVLKEMNSEAVLLTGKEEGRPAEVNLSRGVIMYAGGEGEKKEKDRPDKIGAWASRALDVQGLVSFGEDVSYRPKTFSEKAVDDALKAMRSGTKASTEVIKKYISIGGVAGLMRDLSVGFDVGIIEGSALHILKRGEIVTAKGRLSLEEGGELSLAGHDFIVGGDSGQENYIDFFPGETLRGFVNVTSETNLFNKYLLTSTGEKVHVDEMKIRMILVPPGREEMKDREKRDKVHFLNFEYGLVAEPPRVIGEVEFPGAGEGQASRRTVSFEPTKEALFAALTGQEDLAAAAQEGVGAKVGSAVGSKLLSVPLGLLVRILRFPLGMVGFDVSVGKSELARRQDAMAAANQASADSAGSSGGMGIVAGALDNTELTVRRRIAKNFYFNTHMILLDSTQLMGRDAASVEQNATRPVGAITELSYRTSRYKGTVRTRWFELPDDTKPDADQPKEVFVGGQVNQMFRGVGQKEEFEW
jgi:hypothetical protein